MTEGVDIALSKEMQKFECIGKKGKTSKMIEISVTNLNAMKNNVDEFSLRMIAYILKGIFIILKRSYETYLKEIQSFVDLYVKGRGKNKNIDCKSKSILKSKHTAGDTKKYETSTLPTLNNLNFSLLSENSLYENFNFNFFKQGSKLICEKKRIETSIPCIKSNSNYKDKNTNHEPGDVPDYTIDCLNLEKVKLDMFTNTRDLFSNFINFDVEDIQEENRQILDQKDVTIISHSQNNKTIIPEGFALPKVNLIKRGVTRSRQSLQYDEVLENEIVITKETNLKSQSFRQMISTLFGNHLNSLILQEELDTFKKNLNENNTAYTCTSATDLLTTDFSIEEEEDKKRDNTEAKTSRSASHINFETSNKRKSFDSSALLSNISLNEVFDNSRKLLNKTMNTFNYEDPSSVIEEVDSNMNINTLNLRSNLNNYQIDFQEETGIPSHEQMDYDIISSEIEKVLHVKSRGNRKSWGNVMISIANIAGGIQKDRELPYKPGELESVVLYQMLSACQMNGVTLMQEEPFGEIIAYTK